MKRVNQPFIFCVQLGIFKSTKIYFHLIETRAENRVDEIRYQEVLIEKFATIRSFWKARSSMETVFDGNFDGQYKFKSLEDL